MKLMPHRTTGSVEWGPISVAINGVLGAKSWDYASEMTVTCSAHVPLAEVLRQTGLMSLDAASAVMLVDCPATDWRRRVMCPVGEDGEIWLEAQVPAGVVAKRLVVSRLLCLTREQDGPIGTARFVGDRLSDATTETIALEGVGGRFPVEARSFKQAGFPDGAAWRLDFRPESLDSLYIGSARLMVNTDHPASEALLNGGHEHHVAASSVIRTDVIMQMLNVLAFDHEVLEDDTYDPDSVGGVVETLTRTYLKLSLSDALSRVRSDQAHVASTLQSRLGFLRSGK